MAKRETFTRRTDLSGLVGRKDVEAELKRMDKLLERERIVPESVWLQANALLADEARALEFSSGRSYVECMRETLRLKPFLRLGVCPYAYDREFSAIEFIPEDEA